jgi:hypothetical protein
MTRTKSNVRRRRLAIDFLEDRNAPAMLIVSTASDQVSHAGTSLRDAINTANTDAAAGVSDTIEFDTVLMGGTSITLTQGFLELKPGTGTTTINGGSSISLTGSANGAFKVDAGALAVLNGLLIAANTGAGITNAGNLTASGLQVTGSTASGISNTGTMTLSLSTVGGNTASGNGGGVANTGTMTIVDSTISNNQAIGTTAPGSGGAQVFTGGHGGGMFNSGSMTIYKSLVSQNTAAANNSIQQVSGAGQGGGVFNTGQMSINNSTIYGNGAAGFGGGVYNTTTNTKSLTLANVTLSGNTAFGVTPASTSPGGGGLFNVGTSPLYLQNTIIAVNKVTAVAGDPNSTTAPTAGIRPDINAVVTGGNNNIIGKGTGLVGLHNVSGNRIGTDTARIDPRLTPLANRGGPTLTMSLRNGSPAYRTGGSVARLSGAIDASTTSIIVDNAGGIASTPGSYLIRLGNEKLLVTNVSGNTLTVVRGANGTVAAAHPLNTKVYLALDQRGATRASTPDMGAFASNAAISITHATPGPSVTAGTAVSLNAAAFADPTPTIQWQYSSNDGRTYKNIVGANSETLTFIAQQSQNGYFYRAMFANKNGRVATPPAELFVL